MGTQEQKARRQDYAAKLDKAWNANASGQWTTDEQLRQYLNSIGSSGNALYNQLFSGGGYATYGPSWDPIWNNDFQTGEQIPWQGPGETWYDPSIESNWQKTPELKTKRMGGFFDWRNQNADMIDRSYGGNALSAWNQLRAKSNMPNSPDMSWWNEGNRGASTPTPLTSTTPTTSLTSPTKPIVTSTTKPSNPAVYGTPYGIAGKPTPITTNTGLRSAMPRKPVPAWYSSWKF